MTEASSITTDEHPDFDDDGAAAFFANLTGEAPSTEKSEEASEAPEETQEAPETNPSEPEATPEPDDEEVEVKVGEETHKAKIRDLKRLYGQEAALTQKSQKLAQITRETEIRAAQAGTALQAMVSKAQERYAPYAELDMLVLSQRMDTNDFEQLRRDAAAAKADVDFLHNELGSHMQAEQNRQRTHHAEQAKACIAELSDPVRGIKDFGKPVYDEICSWATSQGLPEVSQVVSPAALKMIHMAMQFERQQAAAKAAEAKAKAAPQKPTRTLKSGARGSEKPTNNDAMARLRRSGTVEDAAAAFLASFG